MRDPYALGQHCLERLTRVLKAVIQRRCTDHLAFWRNHAGTERFVWRQAALCELGHTRAQNELAALWRVRELQRKAFRSLFMA